MSFFYKSILKQLPFTVLVATLATTCVGCSHNSQEQILQAQASTSIKENILFPKSAAIVNVTAPEYGAVPNDGKDDTEAIQKALSKFPNQGKIIYLPNGVYDVSDTLVWPRGVPYNSDYKRTTLQGQSRDGVIIRLRDSSINFQNPARPRPVVSTAYNPNLDPTSKAYKASIVAQRFGNSVRNLTINVGKNNPGAQGLNFAACNQGAVRSVKILSGDGQGTTGLALTHGELGPLLVEDVEVIGFNYGIRTSNSINGITMQNIKISNQKLGGIYNHGQVVSLEGLSSTNSVPAVINGVSPKGGSAPGSTLTLLNANLKGTGNAINESAISSAGFIYARNITATGYKNIVFTNARDAAGVRVIKGTTISEYTSHPIISTFPSPMRSLQLPIKQFPKLKWDDPKTWVSVEQFGAIPNDKKDDTAAFQAAIDSGATTVVVPRTGLFTINGSVKVRGKVRRFLGTEGWLNGTGGEIVADNGSEPTLIIENFLVDYGSKLKWRNVANRTVVFRSITHLDLISEGSGDLFIDDAVMGALKFLNPAQKIWARQLNPEGGASPNVINSGAKLWILGYKTEYGKTKIETTNGGFTELLGGLVYASSKQDPNDPLFRIVNASASFVGIAEAHFDKDTYETWVEETRGNETRKLAKGKVIGRQTANGRVLLLYPGFETVPNQ